MLRRYENDCDGVVELADRLAEVAERHTLPNAEAKSNIFRGWARGMKGELVEGVQELRRGLELQQAVGTDEDMPVYAGMTAELLVRLGRAHAAIALLGDAIDQAERSGNIFWLPELYRARASLRERSDLGLMAPDLWRGLEIARSQRADALVGRIMRDLMSVGLANDQS
jgi:predicted ATPase